MQAFKTEKFQNTEEKTNIQVQITKTTDQVEALKSKPRCDHAI